ncbi:paraquat-inducible protein A [Wenzhouxiangella sediminis]|uniref:Paraquat-inducible protein A n=1 Tax=Wenzhouxiangella sediminis TaxID=1792836 RepID=A0A3E1K7I3_9GAMM|nr:paraquat-inducible protein A [Wenzhouxiangella sediminis]RFF29999.1 paraquat-inducible protein A [Wenzhouxiangella sediminis]
MSGSERSPLFREHPRRFDVPLLIAASAVTLVVGLFMPIVRIESTLASDSSYSIMGGIAGYFGDGKLFIGSIILLFSCVFPGVKLAALGWLWFAPTVRENRRRSLRIIEPLGKWSMLDVLVVILFAGAVKLGLIADATVLDGAYVFAAAILLSMIVVMLIAGIAGPEHRYLSSPRKRSFLLPLLALASLLLLAAGLALPMMKVEKWLLWQESYSVLSGALKLVADGEVLLAAGFFLFVIVLPMLVQLALVVLSLVQLFGNGSQRAIAALIEFQRWAMVDVFALALCIGLIRLADMATIEPRIGLYCFTAAVVLTPIVSFWLRALHKRK